MALTRPMRPKEDELVRKLYWLCNPDGESRPDGYFFAHPTLVMTDRGRIIGSVTGSVSLPATPRLAQWADRIMYGHGLDVHPDHRGRGLGTILFEARLKLAGDVGCKLFLGMTKPTNKSMIRIFEKTGCRFHTTIPEGDVYMKAL